MPSISHPIAIGYQWQYEEVGALDNKNTRTVCIIAQYMHPDSTGSVTRTFYAAKCLARKGFGVVLITTVPHHPDGNADAFRRRHFFRRYYVPGMDIVKVWMPPISDRSSLGRIVNYVHVMCASILVGLAYCKSDIIFASSPNFFTNLAGVFLKMVKHKPLVININDLVPEALNDLGYVKSSKLMKLLVHIRNLTLQLSDKVVCISETISSHLQSNGIDPSKIETIEVGIDIDRFSVEELDPPISIPEDAGIHIVYSGNLGSAYDFEALLEIVEEASRLGKDYRFTIRGVGDQEAKLQYLVRKRRLQNISLHIERLDEQEYRKFMSSADVFILPMKDNMISTTALPSKIFDYLIFRKPVVVIGKGEPARLVERAGAGIAVSHANIDEVLPFLERIQADPALRARMGSDGANYVIKTYSLERIANKFERVFDSILRTSNV